MQNEPELVLDSYAIIGFLENESFADFIEKLLIKAQNGEVKLFLHMIHLGEVYYITLREKGNDTAKLTYSRIRALPIQIIEHIDEGLLFDACEIKAFHPLSYADAFAAALAKRQHCPLLTGDPEFKPLEKEAVIKIQWLS